MGIESEGEGRRIFGLAASHIQDSAYSLPLMTGHPGIYAHADTLSLTIKILGSVLLDDFLKRRKSRVNPPMAR